MSPFPDQKSAVVLRRASNCDLEDLIAIRIEAMRESLERLGRFDPDRARERFHSGFDASSTRRIEVSGDMVGFVVLKDHQSELLLDHLYVIPSAQGAGIGTEVLTRIFREADEIGRPVKVGALKESASNRFYIRHGFVFVESGEFDNYYVRANSNTVRLGDRRDAHTDTFGSD
ncbi:MULTISPECIES: GNAT family N-acetyltransferase [unclassified Pseudomonas]|uniref:GNAT family N-acetyltransferase n=1 Tax=unclassified Pseudomonas TaxID=196821 RepID=UPI00132F06C8|nr:MULTISPECIES: GNAT family N-acetyltransferase [unclassified Pseudomonas]QHF50891.1 GNAT family N-acetyltransferase [Pseudomonas sp. S49]WNZ87086.1 GNAT family N-acetyltransferase [Pseudomonas sp. P108]